MEGDFTNKQEWSGGVHERQRCGLLWFPPFRKVRGRMGQPASSLRDCAAAQRSRLEMHLYWLMTVSVCTVFRHDQLLCRRYISRTLDLYLVLSLRDLWHHEAPTIVGE